MRTSSIETPTRTLSGGNQQKVIVAREVGRDIRMLLASQPTRGLDVGSIEFVHRRIVEQRNEGVAVVIVSSELDEIYALADRIAVMYEGKITGFRPPTVSVGELGLLMAGGSDSTPLGSAPESVGESGTGGRARADEPGQAVAPPMGQPGQTEPGRPARQGRHERRAARRRPTVRLRPAPDQPRTARCGPPRHRPRMPEPGPRPGHRTDRSAVRSSTRSSKAAQPS